MITTLGVVAIGLLILAALYGAGWLFFRALRGVEAARARRRGDRLADHRTRAERVRERRTA